MKKTIQTMLEEEDVERLKKEAKARGHTLSSFLRYLVKLFLKEQGEDKKKTLK